MYIHLEYLYFIKLLYEHLVEVELILNVENVWFLIYNNALYHILQTNYTCSM